MTRLQEMITFAIILSIIQEQLPSASAALRGNNNNKYEDNRLLQPKYGSSFEINYSYEIVVADPSYTNSKISDISKDMKFYLWQGMDELDGGDYKQVANIKNVTASVNDGEECSAGDFAPNGCTVIESIVSYDITRPQYSTTIVNKALYELIHEFCDSYVMGKKNQLLINADNEKVTELELVFPLTVSSTVRIGFLYSRIDVGFQAEDQKAMKEGTGVPLIGVQPKEQEAMKEGLLTTILQPLTNSERSADFEVQDAEFLLKDYRAPTPSEFSKFRIDSAADNDNTRKLQETTLFAVELVLWVDFFVSGNCYKSNIQCTNEGFSDVLYDELGKPDKLNELLRNMKNVGTREQSPFFEDIKPNTLVLAPANYDQYFDKLGNEDTDLLQYNPEEGDSKMEQFQLGFFPFWVFVLISIFICCFGMLALNFCASRFHHKKQEEKENDNTMNNTNRNGSHSHYDGDILPNSKQRRRNSTSARGDDEGGEYSTRSTNNKSRGKNGKKIFFKNNQQGNNGSAEEQSLNNNYSLPPDDGTLPSKIYVSQPAAGKKKKASLVPDDGTLPSKIYVPPPAAGKKKKTAPSSKNHKNSADNDRDMADQQQKEQKEKQPIIINIVQPPPPQQSDEDKNKSGNKDGAKAAEKLPLGWYSAMDNGTGLPYYYHEETGETRWEPPPKEQNNKRNIRKRSIGGNNSNHGDDKNIAPDTAAAVDGSNNDTKNNDKWETHKDNRGNEYYHNPATGETSWDKPDDSVDDSTYSRSRNKNRRRNSTSTRGDDDDELGKSTRSRSNHRRRNSTSSKRRNSTSTRGDDDDELGKSTRSRSNHRRRNSTSSKRRNSTSARGDDDDEIEFSSRSTHSRSRSKPRRRKSNEHDSDAQEHSSRSTHSRSKIKDRRRKSNEYDNDDLEHSSRSTKSRSKSKDARRKSNEYDNDAQEHSSRSTNSRSKSNHRNKSNEYDNDELALIDEDADYIIGDNGATAEGRNTAL